MIKTTAMLLDELASYHDPFGKIKRLLADGQIHQVTRAIYETDGTLPGYLMAPVIYGPSYISFEYALSRYGLIPERVVEYTCATFGKGKKKRYHNHFGDYSYRDVPKAAYPYETILLSEGDYAYFIATPEKALCDKLYSLHPVKNQKELTELLFADLRIDEDELSKLNLETIEGLSELYKSSNVKLLAKFLKRYQHE